MIIGLLMINFTQIRNHLQNPGLLQVQKIVELRKNIQLEKLTVFQIQRI